MIDLHIHTIHSDGTDTVEELLLNAEKANLEIISITDHDSVGAYKELEKEEIRRLFSGKIIVGTELKTHYKGIPIEVLAYGIDYNKMRIHKINLYDIQVKVLEEYKKIGKKLGFVFDDSISISKTDAKRKFAAFVFANEIFKHEENKKILFEIGEECEVATFYRVHSCNKNSIFYYDDTQNYLPLEETIERIHEAGGIAIVAHPLLYPYDNEDKFAEIEKMVQEYKLDGIEVEYPLFGKEDREKLKEIAKKYNKYISGGTDYHAENKPEIKIGTGINENMNICTEMVEDWIYNAKEI